MSENQPTHRLDGSVPWEWLATCQSCGKPHEYRPESCGCGKERTGMMTWKADDGHAYQSRLGAFTVQRLRAEYLAEVDNS